MNAKIRYFFSTLWTMFAMWVPWNIARAYNRAPLLVGVPIAGKNRLTLCIFAGPNWKLLKQFKLSPRYPLQWEAISEKWKLRSLVDLGIKPDGVLQKLVLAAEQGIANREYIPAKYDFGNWTPVMPNPPLSNPSFAPLADAEPLIVGGTGFGLSDKVDVVPWAWDKLRGSEDESRESLRKAMESMGYRWSTRNPDHTK